jgi:hypothetical protein
MIDKNTDKINKLTELIEVLIKREVAPILPVAPVAVVAPVLPIDNTISQDLIVKFTRLEENVRLNFQQVKDAIKELNDGTTTKIAALEIKTEKNINDITKIMTWGSAGVLLLGVLEFIISKYMN